MRLLGRAFLFLLGLLLAIAAGFFTFAVGLAIGPMAWDLMEALGATAFESIWRDTPGESDAAVFLSGLMTFSPVLVILPPALVALVGEVAGLRSFVWYGLATGILAAALPWLSRGGEDWRDLGMLAGEGRITPLLFVIGAVAGLTYWLVAGRSAGISAPASSRS